MFAVAPIIGCYKTTIPNLKTFDVTVPKTFSEAVASPQKEQWILAMDDQITKLNKKHTYEIVGRPISNYFPENGFLTRNQMLITSSPSG